jgi:hypothetical protein
MLLVSFATIFCSSFALHTEPALKVPENMVHVDPAGPFSWPSHQWPQMHWPSFHYPFHWPSAMSPYHYPSHQSYHPHALSTAPQYNSLTATDMAPMDIKDTDSGFHISLDMPGMKKDQITVNVKNNVLTVSGEKKTEEKKDGDKFH